MRTTLIASSLAVLALTGVAGGAVLAAEPDSAPAAPTTTLGGLDMLTDMGLDTEQIMCLVGSMGDTDISDTAAMMELMSECGISMDQLLDIGQQTADTVVADTEVIVVETAPDSGVPVDVDAATAAAVLAVLGVDTAAVDCLVGQAALLPPGDDAAAEQAFIACGVGPAQILAGIVALDAAAGSVTTDSVVTVESDVTTTSLVSETVGTTGNAMVDLLISELADEGITIDGEQGRCLLDHLAELDPNDISATMTVMSECGIDLLDLAGG
jgi:hypothetical protein